MKNNIIRLLSLSLLTFLAVGCKKVTTSPGTTVTTTTTTTQQPTTTGDQTTTSPHQQGTIAWLKSQAAGSQHTISGTIIGRGNDYFFLGDDTGAMIVYRPVTTTYDLGNVVTVTGTTALYNKAIQFGEGATVTVDNAGAAPDLTPETWGNAELNNLLTEPNVSAIGSLITPAIGKAVTLNGIILRDGGSWYLEAGSDRYPIYNPWSTHVTTLETIEDHQVTLTALVYGISFSSGGSVRLTYHDYQEYDGPIDVLRVEIRGLRELNLTLDDEETLTARVIPANADNTAITWSSDNSEFVSVTQEGLIKGEGEGSANITASVMGKEGEVSDTILVRVAGAESLVETTLSFNADNLPDSSYTNESVTYNGFTINVYGCYIGSKATADNNNTSTTKAVRCGSTNSTHSEFAVSARLRYTDISFYLSAYTTDFDADPSRVPAVLIQKRTDVTDPWETVQTISASEISKTSSLVSATIDDNVYLRIYVDQVAANHRINLDTFNYNYQIVPK